MTCLDCANHRRHIKGWGKKKTVDKLYIGCTKPVKDKCFFLGVNSYPLYFAPHTVSGDCPNFEVKP